MMTPGSMATETAISSDSAVLYSASCAGSISSSAILTIRWSSCVDICGSFMPPAPARASASRDLLYDLQIVDDALAIDFGVENQNFDACGQAVEIEFFRRLVALAVVERQAQTLGIDRCDDGFYVRTFGIGAERREKT